MLDDRDGARIERLRRLLDTHGYAGPEAAEALGAPIGSEHRGTDHPLYLRRLADARPLHSLVRLFGLCVSVSEEDARAAFAPLLLVASRHNAVSESPGFFFPLMSHPCQRSLSVHTACVALSYTLSLASGQGH